MDGVPAITRSGLRKRSEVLDAIARGERAAARVVVGALRRELGVTRTFRVLARMGWEKVRGEPFASLGPPVDERDQLSRLQCGDLVLLDRAVRRVAGEGLALSLARRAVHAGAVPFLDAMLPDVEREQLRGLAPMLVGSFFNAEGATRFSEDRAELAFTVRRCRFVELLGAVGAEHLMPLFCEADEAFFDGRRRPIALRRTRTLGTGADECDFRFRLRASQP